LIAPVARVEISAAAPAPAEAAPAVAAAADSVPVPATPAAPAATAAAASPNKPTPAPAEKPPAVAAGKTGEQVYQATCSVCHASGVAGAPKVGDKAAWAARIAGGLPALGKSALAGKGAMPARGGNANLSESEVLRAIVYMANQSGASFKEPAAAPVPPIAPATTASAVPAAPVAKPAEKPLAAPPAEAPAVVAKAETAAPRNNGKAIYQSTCAACHATGNAGAPKVGDIAAWGPRIANGADALLGSALKGKGAMPPKGGNAKLSDSDVHAALEYMLGQFK
jgi:cytochrome c5